MTLSTAEAFGLAEDMARNPEAAALAYKRLQEINRALLIALAQNATECESWLKTSSIRELRQTLRNVIEQSRAAIANAKVRP